MAVEGADDPRIVAAAAGLRRARVELGQALDVLNQDPPPRYRLRSLWMYRRNQDRAWATARDAKNEIWLQTCTLENNGAGADIAEWGVLSVAGSMQLERTLERLAARNEDPKFAGAVSEALSQMPSVRAASVLGDHTALQTFELSVLELVARAPDDVARQLANHLPARVRPLPGKVSELDHHRSYTLSVTENTSRIRLHDIVMGAGTQGHGFGTSLLQELCRYADSRGLPIVCEMVAGYPRIGHQASREEFDAQRRTDEIRLAGWYHRHGFRAEKPVDEWTSFTALRREPAGNVSSPDRAT